MDGRERLLGCIYRKPIDRVPMMEMYWEGIADTWRGQGMPATDKTPGEFFGMDQMNFAAIDWSFQYPEEVVEETDEYTVKRSSENILVKTRKDSPLPEFSDFPVTGRDSWEAIKHRIEFNEKRIDIVKAKTDQAATENTHLQVYIEPCLGFEKYKYCMGTEGILNAIGEDPEWVLEMIEATERLAFDGLDYCLGCGMAFDIAYVTEDLGFATGPFFSPAFYKNYMMPSHKRFCDYCRSKGMKVMLHSCGAIMKLMPMLVEAGFELLNPLEQKAGMDLYTVKKEYGDRLVLWGGIDVKTISFGTDGQLRDEIRDKVTFAKQGGGYIFGSDHSIPLNVSYDRYLKMVEWGLEYGKY